MLLSSTPTEKQCTRCKQTKLLKEFPPHPDGKFGLDPKCFECYHISQWEYRNTFNGFFSKLLSAARTNSNHRLSSGRIEAGVCNIIREDLITIWNRQNGKCYYSGIQMIPQPNSNWQCSLERFDNNKGYTTDNISLVCLEFNNYTKWTLDKIKRMLFFIYEYNDDIFLLQEIDNILNSVKSHKKREPNVTNDIGHCKCKKCDIFKPKIEFIKDLSKGCGDCRKKYKKEYKSTIKGHLYELIYNAKHHATKSNNSNRSDDIVFDITSDDLVALLRSQYGKCAYSGIKLNYGFSHKRNWVASLERINPLKGYTRDNVCLVCAEFNGVDYTAITKYFNGGSGAWSREKFNFFLSTVLSNIPPNLTLNLNGLSISLDMWKSINNPLYIQRFPTANFQLEIIDPVGVEQFPTLVI